MFSSSAIGTGKLAALLIARYGADPEILYATAHRREDENTDGTRGGTTFRIEAYQVRAPQNSTLQWQRSISAVNCDVH
jgi:hypothetical protein